MGKLSAYPSSVNLDSDPLPLHIRRQLNAQAVCPWCGRPMYVNSAGDRLLCADPIHCAGVQPISASLRAACDQLAARKDVA